jgi:hypothetical protein
MFVYTRLKTKTIKLVNSAIYIDSTIRIKKHWIRFFITQFQGKQQFYGLIRQRTCFVQHVETYFDSMFAIDSFYPEVVGEGRDFEYWVLWGGEGPFLCSLPPEE